MKKVKLLLMAATMLAMSSCGPQPVVVTQQQPYQQQQQQYQVMYGPSGQQQVVFYDNGIQQVMEYAMFMSLMNSGGYTNVIHHYHEPTYHVTQYNSRNYSNWRQGDVVKSDGTSTRTPGSFGSGSAKAAPINTASNSASSGWKSTTTDNSKTNTGWKSTNTIKPSASSGGGWNSSGSTSAGSGWKSSSSSYKSSGGFGGRRK